YKKAEEEVDDPRLIEFFKSFEKKRYHFGHDLKGEIKRLGGEIDKGTSVKGNVERFWMRLKAVIVTDNEQAILSECRKIEMENWEYYNQALSVEGLSDETRKILVAHKANIDEALYQIIELKDNYATV
ncbi:PA2169 family four-helix-bundle protein, partial [Fulvivirga sp. RKSG066]|uniref:PA2169 family four-helix-bundle protein n=1 Tax=Fulvivirga aurantia TaxID=2529383 RepID=UPI0012BBC4C3